ncbi:Dihydrolipoamide acetyltransferase component (E2) of acetoin dehydrogenase complex / Dihydrolipoamide dehydrogenase of acetoin dehydrogenase [hydrothermal vent metagenome]|uniref:Dihydrolipoamide acetyltransferase component (E2) of acetoin dehydrogenase complex / Dihydrolipoamide dehydrogenase of acetoin dehydrogenase n=1 Tax=hydrothermal vent metagenome TaxID=652676 RepID=A0A3B0Z3J4_9ZZZZ
MAEPYVIKMPQLSDTMTEGVVVSWEKNVGDRIERGDIVATVETDKAIMDVEVFREGYLSGPLAPVDSTVPVGEPMAWLVATPEEVNRGDAPASTAVVAEPEAETARHSEPASVADSTPATAQAIVSDAPAAAESTAPEGASYTITMPQLSDTMTEGVLVSWEKDIGDKIARGDIVAQVETDKAIMDVEVFREGYLSGPRVPVDATVPVGDPLAYLVDRESQVINEDAAPVAAVKAGSATAAVADDDTSAAAPSVAAPAARVTIPAGGTPAPRPPGRGATPYARAIAGARGIDLSGLGGTGPGGVIVAADVQSAQPATAPAAAGFPQVDVPGDGRPMNKLEKAISDAMTSSLSMPTFHVTSYIKLGALIKASKAQGASVTVTIAKACAMAMQQFPKMNWCYQPQDKLVERSNVDIGMAVSADGGGLVVPVLRHCESRELDDLGKDWKDLVERARKRRLKPDEYSGSTFQISNMGMFGVNHFDAIATPGIAAILAISANTEQGSPFTITADHRVVNGAEVALYLKALKEHIEQPDAWMGPSGPAIPEGNWDYDVVVVGGGPGGEDCARDLVAHGLKVAMINDSPLPGGECLWRGCIPSKAWRAAADRIRDRLQDSHLGITPGKPKLDWKALEATRCKVLETRGDMALKTDKGVKIKYVQGFGRFVDDHTVFVDTSGNQDDPHTRAEHTDKPTGETMTFGCAVIATGAPPFVPPIPGAVEGLVEGGGVLTSDTVWQLEQQPKKLVVIGGGAIGLEMAQIFQDFGTNVTLLEAKDRILAEVEPEIAKHLTGVLNDDPRLVVHTSVQIDRISGKAGAVTVKYKDSDGKAHSIKVDYVIMGTGKRPVLDGLDLDKAGVASEHSIIKADARCRTNVSHIFAIGDVIGGLMLAHTAAQQGRVAAATILGEDMKYDQDKDCGVIFTRPEAAFVGLSIDQAKAKGIDAVEAKVPMSIDAKAMINNELHGMIKIVADKKTQRIIGVHLLADHADTLIGEAVLMVSGNMTLEQVGHAIHPHPTQTEMFGELARRLGSRLRRSAKMKKAKV